MQAGFKAEQVQVSGSFSDFTRISDEADRKEGVFHFCPECGSQVFTTEPADPDVVVVSVGSFADPYLPPPTESGYDSRRHPGVHLPDSVRAACPGIVVGLGPASLRGRQVRRGGGAGSRADRGAIPTSRTSTSIPRAARASRPAGRSRRSPPPSDRDVRTAAASWQRTTRTSTRSATSRRFEPSSATPARKHRLDPRPRGERMERFTAWLPCGNVRIVASGFPYRVALVTASTAASITEPCFTPPPCPLRMR